MDDKNNVSGKFDLAIAVSMAVAWMYMLGSTYRQAFFWEIGLRRFTLSIGFEETLLIGLTALVGASSRIVVWIAFAIEILLFLALSYGIVRSLKRVNIWFDVWKSRREKGRPAMQGHMDKAVAKTWSLAFPLMAFLIAFIVILASGLIAESQGGEAAKRLLESEADYPSGQHMVFLSNGKGLSLGPMIGCDERVCVYLAKGQAVVIKRELIAAETGVVPASPNADLISLKTQLMMSVALFPSPSGRRCPKGG